MDFVASLAAAVKQRNVLGLLEATLRLNAGSEMVPPLVQRLAFQVPNGPICLPLRPGKCLGGGEVGASLGLHLLPRLWLREVHLGCGDGW